ncbi:MAG: acetyltransferase [Rhodospirillales bacterium]|nr:acetyltransferase [Rhodospirillales bacterium]
MIRSARLLLRAYESADAQSLVALLGDFEVARWLARVPHPYTIDDADAWIELSKSEARRSFAITRDGALVGGIGLGRRPDGAYELGYWIGRRFHRNGYAEEASRKLLQVAFADWRVARVVVSALPDNAPSLALIAKLGFRPIGLQPFYVPPLRPWPAVIPHFEQTR